MDINAGVSKDLITISLDSVPSGRTVLLIEVLFAWMRCDLEVVDFCVIVDAMLCEGR